MELIKPKCEPEDEFPDLLAGDPVKGDVEPDYKAEIWSEESDEEEDE